MLALLVQAARGRRGIGWSAIRIFVLLNYLFAVLLLIPLMAFNLAGGSFWPASSRCSASASAWWSRDWGRRLRVPVLRVPAHHPPRRRDGRAAERGPRPALNRPLLAHLAWTGLILAAAATLIGLELGADRARPAARSPSVTASDVRPFAIIVVGLAAVLYVGGLSAVRWWTNGLRAAAWRMARARDWYLLAGALGLLAAPLLAFTLASALR